MSMTTTTTDDRRQHVLGVPPFEPLRQSSRVHEQAFLQATEARAASGGKPNQYATEYCQVLERCFGLAPVQDRPRWFQELDTDPYVVQVSATSCQAFTSESNTVRAIPVSIW
jgi:hypothetical protein